MIWGRFFSKSKNNMGFTAGKMDLWFMLVPTFVDRPTGRLSDRHAPRRLGNSTLTHAGVAENGRTLGLQLYPVEQKPQKYQV